MNFSLYIALVVCIFQFSLAQECSEEPGLCDVDGVPTPFDCNQVCCGGQIFNKSSDAPCCGSAVDGIIYDPATQHCCAANEDDWMLFEKVGRGEQCCGPSLIFPEQRNETACCQGWQRAAPFNFYEEMCCNGFVSFVGDTAYGQCCGEVGYDRRSFACPCNQPPVIEASPNAVQCCRSNDNSVLSAIIQGEEGCCNGVGFSLATQFCCGNVVGDLATQVCCNNVLAEVDPEAGGSGCCVAADGSTVTYNADTAICCDGVVTELPEGETGFCCAGTVFSNPSDGDACCVDSLGDAVAYDSQSNVCCEGVVSEGDSCCGVFSYFKDSQQCCDGVLSDSTEMVTPSCCVNQTFDSSIQTCCGATVYENPLIETAEGVFNVSSTTRCCGDYSDLSSLRPYDYLYSLCCEGFTFDVGAGSSLQCCGATTFDPATSICCQGVIYNPSDYALEEGAVFDCNYINNLNNVEEGSAVEEPEA